MTLQIKLWPPAPESTFSTRTKYKYRKNNSTNEIGKTRSSSSMYNLAISAIIIAKKNNKSFSELMMNLLMANTFENSKLENVLERGRAGRGSLYSTAPIGKAARKRLASDSSYSRRSHPSGSGTQHRRSATAKDNPYSSSSRQQPTPSCAPVLQPVVLCVLHQPPPPPPNDNKKITLLLLLLYFFFFLSYPLHPLFLPRFFHA